MASSLGGSAARARRKELKDNFWPKEAAWLGAEETGYFCAPRSLPFILQALAQKSVSGDRDPSAVYLELLARHHGQGVVEMTYEEDHAFAAGYTTQRAARTWRDRMKVLVDAGFIKVTSSGKRYSKVLLVHPSLAMRKLYEAGKISEPLWQAFRTRQIEVKENLMDEPEPEPEPPIHPPVRVKKAKKSTSSS